ncbi:MAG: hypothetical protein JNM80_12355 [Phycisphaerae bacterium]|nr:hypothetical protein [Phycisphaerae bacterium]
MSQLTPLSDDARFELAMIASGHERRSRPVGLVIVVVAALVLALVLASSGLISRASARARLRSTLADQARAEQLLAEWTQIEQQAKDALKGSTGAPIANLYSQMENLATRAGMKDKPRTPRAKTETRAGVVVNEYTYADVRDPSLPALMEWLRLATSPDEGIRGLEVYGLNLRPSPSDWSMTVTFRRWERPS